MKARRLAIGWLACVPICACAAPAASERERIADERAAATATFVAQQRACQAQFAVTACVEAARQAQTATLTRLHRQQMQLDDAKRREAAAGRAQAIRSKVEAKEARRRDTPAADEAAEAIARDGDETPAKAAKAAGAEKADKAAKAQARSRAMQSRHEATLRRSAERGRKKAAP